MPTPLQLSLLALTGLLFAAAFALGWRHMRRLAEGTVPVGALANSAASMGPASRAAIMVATLLDIGLLVWRAASEHKLTLPLSNHFDAFLLLALLLAIVLVYFRWTRHLRSFSFFLLPMIVILLFLGAMLSILSPQGYEYGSIWARFHILTIIAGTVCFSLGCVGGAVYLIAHRQLKHKGGVGGRLDASHRWNGLPPLASIEKFNQGMVYLGFPLLTVAIFTGMLRAAQEPDVLRHAGMVWKIALAALAWVVYAVLAHLPLAPRFRGPNAAWLWIIGFALFIGGFVAANWMRVT